MTQTRKIAVFCLLSASTLIQPACTSSARTTITLNRRDDLGRLDILIDGRTALTYNYGADWDIVHYWPLYSPSGKIMLVQKTEPYPHHRSFWFADTVKLEGRREVSTYNALYSGVAAAEDGEYGPPFKDRIRHLSFDRFESEGDRAEVESRLVWEMDGVQPVLDERRLLRVLALGDGEYLLDVSFTLTASYGDVEFVSDEVHYAWPYLRMHPRFSGEEGGTLISDSGARGQEATNLKPALWLDYFNTVEGVTEGLAFYQMPDGREHRWLTREYGCFGPRRPDEASGHPFVLKRGESLGQRVGVLVHRGDVKAGRVAERYAEYISDHRPQ